MADETLYVDPPLVRAAGGELSDIGEKLGGDYGKARESLQPDESISDWAVVRASGTLGKLWEPYLSGLGKSVGDYGERLDKVADAYQRRDEEAAAELGIALPEQGPVVRTRPGQVPE